jgi:tetratricopeptide (TPR) repeat protein
MSLAAASLLLSLTLPPEVPAAAAASPRPGLCLAETGNRSALWARARPVEVERFCATLARSLARLERAPAEALELARDASAMFPSETLGPLLEGRALLRLGRRAEAWQRLAPLVVASAPALDDAASLHDVARAALLSGALEDAQRLYRLLMPRSVVLGSERIRRTATIEAAALALARGPADLEEALGYLAEARASPAAGDLDLVLGLLALTLDRAGRREQARAVAREASGPYELEGLLSEAERARVAMGAEPGAEPAGGAIARGRPLLPEGEIHGVLAALAEGRDPALRRAHLTAFLASPAGKGPWAEHARRALEGGKGAR